MEARLKIRFKMRAADQSFRLWAENCVCFRGLPNGRHFGIFLFDFIHVYFSLCFTTFLSRDRSGEAGDCLFDPQTRATVGAAASDEYAYATRVLGPIAHRRCSVQAGSPDRDQQQSRCGCHTWHLWACQCQPFSAHDAVSSAYVAGKSQQPMA